MSPSLGARSVGGRSRLEYPCDYSPSHSGANHKGPGGVILSGRDMVP
jgi:hypothetical protein